MTMDNDFLSSNRVNPFANDILYRHDVSSTPNLFHGGLRDGSSLTVVSNENPSAVKLFKSLSLESSSNAWTGQVSTNQTNTGTQQFGQLGSFSQKEGNQYVDMPRSINNSSSNITFVGTVDLDVFTPQFLQDNFYFETGGESGLDIPLNNTPDVALPTSTLGGSFLFAGNPAVIIGIAEDVQQGVLSMSAIDSYPNTDNNQNWPQVMKYNEGSNTLTISFSNAFGLSQLYGAFQNSFFGEAGVSALDNNNGNDVPIYIMTDPAVNGDNMRGPALTINLVYNPYSAGPFELFAINVDYEKTKLDGSLG